MTLYTKRALIVIPASRQAQANTLAQNVDPAGGAETFSVGLVSASNPTGPIVAYWCSWALQPAQQVWIKNHLDALADANIHVFDASTITPDAVLAQLGLAWPTVAT